MTAFDLSVLVTICSAAAVYVWCVTHPQNAAEGDRRKDRRGSVLGSRLDQDQNATTLAKATADAQLAASLS